MGRNPSCSKDGLNKGAWTAMEDQILTDYVKVHGEGKWGNICKRTGLKRCGKSCRLRWLNYLRPDIKRGNITPEEEDLIIRLHKLLGNRWSLIAGRLPGRTDNEIKNYWNTNLSKRAHQGKQLSNNDARTDKKPIPESLNIVPCVNANAGEPYNSPIATQQHHRNPLCHVTINGCLSPPMNVESCAQYGEGLGSLTSKEEDISISSSNSCDDQFVTGFSTPGDISVSDLLDSDFTKLSHDLDIHGLTSFTEGDGDVINNNKTDKPSHFSGQAILATEWSCSHGNDTYLQANMDSDLEFLASFLESSDQEWMT